MISDNSLRRAVKIVAWILFLLSCFNLLTTILIAFYFDSLQINFLDFVNLFATFGLLNWRNGWRKYAIVMFWLTAVPMAMILPILPMVNLMPHKFNAYKPIICSYFSVWVIYSIFALIILHNRRVKAMFAPAPAPGATAVKDMAEK